jgi:hypothetical protein
VDSSHHSPWIIDVRWCCLLLRQSQIIFSSYCRFALCVTQNNARCANVLSCCLQLINFLFRVCKPCHSQTLIPITSTDCIVTAHKRLDQVCYFRSRVAGSKHIIHRRFVCLELAVQQSSHTSYHKLTCIMKGITAYQ